VIVHLTQDDIDNQTRGNCFDCGLSRAIRRATGEPFGVSLTTAFLDGHRYQLPPEAIDARERLDRDEAVSPMSFEFPDEPLEATC
jgi:hypothetical protein